MHSLIHLFTYVPTYLFNSSHGSVLKAMDFFFIQRVGLPVPQEIGLPEPWFHTMLWSY